jgi:hypothetical protein
MRDGFPDLARDTRYEKAVMVWRNHDGFEMGTKARRGDEAFVQV